MTASIILEKLPSEIQTAMALSLLQLKYSRKLSLADIGSVIGRSKESVSQYVSDETEMGATCWLRAIAKWPELSILLVDNLDDTDKAARARQRALDFEQKSEAERGA